MISRDATKYLLELAENFPVVAITGPRQSGARSQQHIGPLPLVALRIVQSGNVLFQILGIAVLIAVLVGSHGR